MASSSTNSISPAFFDETAQFAHFGIAAMVYLTVGTLAPVVWVLCSLPVGIGFMAFKEFWYDPRYENTVTRGSSVKDFGFYFLGMAYACLILYLRRLIYGV